MGVEVSEATTQADSAAAAVRAQAQAAPATAAETALPPAPSARLPPRLARGNVIAFQRRIGNRAVSRLVAPQQRAGSVLSRQILARDTAGATTAPPLPDGITCKSCSGDQAAQIGAAHERAKVLARNAIAKLTAYDGTSPGDVRDALNRNFRDTSVGAAHAVARALGLVIGRVSGTSYVCKAEANGSTEAMAIWCVPFTDIRVYPLFYNNPSVNYRGSTLLHEWMHRYHCDLDLGYSWEHDYGSNSSTTQFWNADAYATLAYEIGQPQVGDFDRSPSDSGAA
jgi:hypothetical protein